MARRSLTGYVTPPGAAFNLIEAARTGYRTGELIASSSLSEADYATLLQSYTTLSPDLAWVCLGANDYLNDAAGVTPSAVAALLSRQVDDLRALPSSPSVMIVVPHNLVGHENSGRTWAEYRAAIIGVSTSKATGLFDLATVLPTAGTSSGLLRSDGLHPSDAGHQAISDAVRGFLAGLITNRPTWAARWIGAQSQDSATMLAIGDSLTEGQGASTKALRWVSLLQAAYPAAQSLPKATMTHSPARYGVYGPDSTWGAATTATTGSFFNQDFTPGLGRRCVELDANATMTFTVNGSSAEIWVASSKSLSYQVDGGRILPLPGYYSGALGGTQRAVIPLGFPRDYSVKIINGDMRFTYLFGISGIVDDPGGPMPSSATASAGGETSLGGTFAYVHKARSNGSVTVTSTTMAPLVADGSLDLEIGAKAGDVILVVRNAQTQNQSGNLDWNVQVLNASNAEIRRLGGSGDFGAIGAWTIRTIEYFGASGEVSFVVQAGDVIGGKVKLRLMARSDPAGRIVLADSTVPFLWWAANHGTPGAGGSVAGAVTLDTDQTITGVKTFGVGKLLMTSSSGTGEPYSDANPPMSLDRTITTAPGTPAAGESVEWTTDGKSLDMKAPDGTTTRIGPAPIGTVNNAAVTTPAAGFAADTYLAGSSCAIPTGRLKATSMYRLKFRVSKTAAGTAAPVVNIRLGTAGTTADTARCTLTFAAQTAAVDTGMVEVFATFRTTGSGTTAVLHAAGILDHQLTTTGLSTLNSSLPESLSSGFDSTVAGLVIGASVNGGTSAAWTISMVQAELFNLT